MYWIQMSRHIQDKDRFGRSYIKLELEINCKHRTNNNGKKCKPLIQNLNQV